MQSSSLGGVYIAGGIVPNFIEFIKDSDFRMRFEAKGRLSGITKQTPTYIITEAQPGLLNILSRLFSRPVDFVTLSDSLLYSEF